MATREQALQWVEILHRELSHRRLEITRQFAYYRGDQPLAFASEQWQRAYAERYRGFADNWCGVVGRAPVNRLRINGFRLGSSVDVLTRQEQDLWSAWNRNAMEKKANQGFEASTVAKRSAVIVWGDRNDQPVMEWEHPEQVVVAYAPGGSVRRAALKAWVDDSVEYATLYLPDEVWKFQRAAHVAYGQRQPSGIMLPPSAVRVQMGGWEPRQPAEDDTWPLRNPLGKVPVVEWRNRPDLKGNPISDIDGVIAMQDAMNLLWAYLFNAADIASMPARVVLGQEPPKIPVLNEQGQVIGAKPANLEELRDGRLLFLPSATSIDQWEAAKLDTFTGVMATALAHVAAQTSTPGHYLVSNEKFANLNGDALTAAEVPLADKVENQQLHYSEDAKETTALMADVMDERGLADQIRATSGRQFVQWRDAAHHSPAQQADAATKDKSIGMSLRTILERRYGMTEAEIDREMTRIREERADPQLQALTEAVITGASTSVR